MGERYEHCPRQGMPPHAPLWTKNFILATTINLFMFLGFQCFPSALPPYVKSLGASDSTLGWLMGVATVSTLLTRPIAGLLLDRLGRRSVFLCGILLMTAISGAMYFFPVVVIILLLRFIHGLGWGVANTAASTVAADCIPKLRFGEGMGFFSLSASVGMAVSPAIALSLSPGAMFAVATVFMGISAVLALFLKYKNVKKSGGNGKLLKNPYEKAAILPALIMFLMTTPMGATLTFMAIYAAERGIGNIGPYFTTYAVIMMITRPGTGKIVDRYGFKLVMPLGLVSLSLALVLLSSAGSMSMFLLSAVFYGIGQGTVFMGSQTLAIVRSPPDRVGAANATFFTGFDAGIGIGAVASGFLAGFTGYAGMFLCLAACPLIAFVIFLFSLRSAEKAG